MFRSTRGAASPLRLLLLAGLSLLPCLAVADPGKCFLWKVESKSATLHLLGSLHMADQSLYPLDTAIEGAFKNSDTLVVEVNMLEVDRDHMRDLIQSKAAYGEGESLDKDLSKETLEKLEAFLARQGLSVEMVSTRRPWLVSVLVNVTEARRLGSSEELGIDRHFLGKASESKKRILQLTTAESQVTAMADLSKKMQELLLLSTLDDYADAGKFMESLFKAWKTGDVKTIESLLRKTGHKDSRLEPLMEKRFDDRNVKMVQRIERYLTLGGTYFVVVGAGHLVGKKGLVQLLRDKGFKVEQVESAGAPAKSEAD